MSFGFKGLIFVFGEAGTLSEHKQRNLILRFHYATNNLTLSSGQELEDCLMGEKQRGMHNRSKMVAVPGLLIAHTTFIHSFIHKTKN
jgi:hypothetical protein